MTRDYTPAVFTRDNPCTKVEIHNCFASTGRYADTPVVEAKTIIGENVPKYLLREEYVVVRLIGGVDHYCLTPDGRKWLQEGILRYLELHPERVTECVNLPPGYASPAKAPTGAQGRIIRRTRA